MPWLGTLEAQLANVAAREPVRQAIEAWRTPEEVTLRPATFHEARYLSSPGLVVHRAVGPPAAVRVPPGRARYIAILEGWNWKAGWERNVLRTVMLATVLVSCANFTVKHYM